MPANAALDTFDHVVVLMLENRSFDNLFGYLYPDGAPNGKPFEGVTGKALSNPNVHGQSIAVSMMSDPHAPYPDPGEEFDHIITQVFGDPDNPVTPPPMSGFVKDYDQVLHGLQNLPFPKKDWPGSPETQSAAIMRCLAIIYVTYRRIETMR